jgi:hypothetical protein
MRINIKSNAMKTDEAQTAQNDKTRRAASYDIDQFTIRLLRYDLDWDVQRSEATIVSAYQGVRQKRLDAGITVNPITLTLTIVDGEGAPVDGPDGSSDAQASMAELTALLDTLPAGSGADVWQAVFGAWCTGYGDGYSDGYAAGY